MKTTYTTLILLFCLLCGNASAQAPQAISYQAIARNNSGEPLILQTIALRFTVRDASPAGTIVYRETQSTTTTALGLFTVNVGQGTVVTGTFATINWGGGTKYLQVEMDPANGTAYTSMGTQQMLSVPYALNAANGNWDKSGNDITNSNTGNVGIGITPTEKLHVSGNLLVTGKGNIGSSNTNSGSNAFVVGSGNSNSMNFATITGGSGNTIPNSGSRCGIFTGLNNNVSGERNTVVGGSVNVISGGSGSIIGNGHDNTINTSDWTVIGGGANNFITGPSEWSTIGGGSNNTINNFAQYSVIPGGRNNTVSAAYSLAAGRRAKALHAGTFVWADNTDADFSSTGVSQFLIRANSVGIGTNSPSGKLEIKDGDVTINNTASSASLILNRNNVLGGTANQIAFQESGTNKWAIGGTNIGGGGSGNFSLYNYNTASNAITVGGGDNNIGIGTLPSGSKLDVNGSIRLTNTLGSSGGNIGVATPGASNAKLYLRSDQDFGVYIENPTAPINAFYVLGSAGVSGTLSKGGGSFKIDHPLDPANKYLYHSFVESPDMMNVYNGNITTDANGSATVELPDYFEALNKDFRYQLTAIGDFAQVIVAEEVSNNRFVIKSDKPNIKVSWQVTGIRHDAFAEKNRIPNSVEKTGEEKGYYLHPDAFGLSEDRNVKNVLLKK